MPDTDDSWIVREHRDIVKWLRKHPSYEERYREARSILSSNPRLGEPLKGRCKGLWKLRVGDLRVIYEINYDERVVYVWVIGDRENVYEGLC